MNPEFLHKDVTEAIIGAAMKVLNTLKPGLDEKIYERALVVELLKRGRRIDQQQRFEVYYEGVWVGTLQPDLIVDGVVIADPKVVKTLSDHETAQMLGYLAITKLNVSILLNFKYAKLQWKRIVTSDDPPPECE